MAPKRVSPIAAAAASRAARESLRNLLPDMEVSEVEDQPQPEPFLSQCYSREQIKHWQETVRTAVACWEREASSFASPKLRRKLAENRAEEAAQRKVKAEDAKNLLARKKERKALLQREKRARQKARGGEERKREERDKRQVRRLRAAGSAVKTRLSGKCAMPGAGRWRRVPGA